jgi:geranylgeranyl diphosphate synthase, type II
MIEEPDYATFFEGHLAAVEAALDAALPPVSAPVEGLCAAMRYGVFPGGKRIRPLLVLASTEVCGGIITDALPAATALELIHCYTLIHDDLPCMDNDMLRRGQPTCHVRYGEAMALLAGDALLTLAFEVVSRSRQAPADLVLLLARAAGAEGVIAGQSVDLAAAGQRVVAVDTLDYIHRNKTAALFQVALRAGAVAAGYRLADPVCLQLESFGLALGLAFQYVDDLLDDGKDQAFSSVTVLGLNEVRQRAAAYTHEAIERIAAFGDAGKPLRVLAQCMLKREE